MSVDVSFAVFYTVADSLFWDLPGDVLAAPASALCGWKGVILSLSLMCGSHHLISQVGWSRRDLILFYSVCDCLHCSVLDELPHDFRDLLVLYATHFASRICQGFPGSTCFSPVWLERCQEITLHALLLWVSVAAAETQSCCRCASAAVQQLIVARYVIRVQTYKF